MRNISPVLMVLGVVMVVIFLNRLPYSFEGNYINKYFVMVKMGAAVFFMGWLGYVITYIVESFKTRKQEPM